MSSAKEKREECVWDKNGRACMTKILNTKGEFQVVSSLTVLRVVHARKRQFIQPESSQYTTLYLNIIPPIDPPLILPHAVPQGFVKQYETLPAAWCFSRGCCVLRLCREHDCCLLTSLFFLPTRFLHSHFFSNGTTIFDPGAC